VLAQAERLTCASTLHLLQALIGAELPVPPRLWILTRGAQPAGERHQLAVAQAPIWGFGRVVALEQPKLWGGAIDLDPDPSESPTDALTAELTQSDGEDQIALRRGRRYV